MASRKYGLTPNGYIRPGMEDLREEIKVSIKEILGPKMNTASNSALDKFISVFAEREYELWLLGGGVYQAQTQAGAEGMYLDDLFAKRGVYRRGKTRSTGTAQMTLNASVPYNMIYSVAAWDIDAGNFELTKDVQVAGNIIAHSILSRDLRVGEYRFTIQNTSDRTTKNLTLNLTNTTPNSAPLNKFFSDIKRFIVENTIQTNDARIFIDSAAGQLWIGYDTSKRLIGLSTRVDFRTSPLVGDKTIDMGLRATEAGDLARGEGSITSISPTPSGFVSLTNIKAFADGSDVESDNAYRVRAASTISNANATTRPAILSRLLNTVEGVEKVKIFANNTDKTNSLGIPPYKFMTVVYGGDTDEINKALYETIALSNVTYGAVFTDITTEDDQIETVYHTKAEQRNIAVRVKYQGRPVSIVEETEINNALVAMVNGGSIAATLYNHQLGAVVSSTIRPDRFTKVIVEVKNVGQPDTSYTSNDVKPATTQLFNLSADNITYSQII